MPGVSFPDGFGSQLRNANQLSNVYRCFCYLASLLITDTLPVCRVHSYSYAILLGLRFPDERCDLI